MGIDISRLRSDRELSGLAAAAGIVGVRELADRTANDPARPRLRLQPVVFFRGSTEAEALRRSAEWVEQSLGDAVVLGSWFKYHGDEGGPGEDCYEVGLVLEC